MRRETSQHKLTFNGKTYRISIPKTLIKHNGWEKGDIINIIVEEKNIFKLVNLSKKHGYLLVKE